MDDCELSSTLIEDGVADTSVKKRPRKKHLYSQILNQMEFYFSDANLSRDRFLFQQIQYNKNVSLDVFLRFNKIRALTTDVNDIAKALGCSQLLKVSEDGKCVYRTSEIQKKENQDDCIIYVEQLPPDANHDWVSGIFSAYGKVEYVSIPKYKNRAAIKGFAFVEFDTPEAAKKALEAFGSVGCCLPPQMPPEELCSIATFEKKDDPEQLADSSQEDEQTALKHKKKSKRSKDDSQEDMAGLPGESEEKTEEEDREPRAKKIKVEEQSGEKQKKKSKKYENEAEEVPQDPLENVTESEMENVSVKKVKKRKLVDDDGDHGSENTKEGTDHFKKKKKNKDKNEDDSNDETLQDSRQEKKKKRKLYLEEGGGDSKTEMEEMELDDTKGACDSQQMKRKKKKKKLEVEANSETEDTDNDEGTTKRKKTDIDEVETADDLSTKKKRSRKRNKTKKKKEGDHLFGLRIISKAEWRRLRNKYLNLQREKMQGLKKHLARKKIGSNYQSPYPSQGNGRQVIKTGHQDVKDEEKPGSRKTSYIPGVIIKIRLSEPLQDANSFKINARAHQEVKYVDANDGQSETFIRCTSADAAQKLISEQKWENMHILEGDAESAYWQKIEEDRNVKVKNKIRANVRGKDKLLKRAERELGKHIKFDD